MGIVERLEEVNREHAKQRNKVAAGAVSVNIFWLPFMALLSAIYIYIPYYWGGVGKGYYTDWIPSELRYPSFVQLWMINWLIIAVLRPFALGWKGAK